MRRKPDLHIRFFNEFSITSPHYEYAPSSHNSTQLTLLISYLVVNQDTKVPKDVLMAMLWPDEKEKCPVGALRNLVYRARKELKGLYPDQRINYIKFTQDAYYWNPDIYCKVDILDFENYNNLIRHESDPEKQFRYYSRMQRLYTGEFLSNHTAVEWVQYRSAYYKNMYINCTLNMCEYLYERESYDELISLCDRSIILDPEDERFYRHKLMAYLGMNLMKTALEYYQQTVDFFSSKYGTDIINSMRDIYQMILARMPERNLDIDELETSLNVDDDNAETFNCNFDTFKKLYQFSILSAKQIARRHYLLLLTLNVEDADMPNTFIIKQIMENFHAVLAKNLRKDDVFTRTALTQYSVILTVKAESDINIITDRLQKAFQTITSGDMILDIEAKELS